MCEKGVIVLCVCLVVGHFQAVGYEESEEIKKMREGGVWWGMNNYRDLTPLIWVLVFGGGMHVYPLCMYL